MITASNKGFPFGAKSGGSEGRIEGKAGAGAPHPFAGCKHRQEEGPCGSGSGASGSRNVIRNVRYWEVLF